MNSFNFSIDDELNLVNITDFDEITFGKDNHITIRTKSGYTEGMFVPEIEHADMWLLTMNIIDSQMMLVLENPFATIRKISQ